MFIITQEHRAAAQWAQQVVEASIAGQWKDAPGLGKSLMLGTEFYEEAARSNKEIADRNGPIIAEVQAAYNAVKAEMKQYEELSESGARRNYKYEADVEALSKTVADDLGLKRTWVTGSGSISMAAVKKDIKAGKIKDLAATQATLNQFITEVNTRRAAQDPTPYQWTPEEKAAAAARNALVPQYNALSQLLNGLHGRSTR